MFNYTHKYWYGLGIADSAAHDTAEGPVLQQQHRYRGEGHTEESHEDVADSEVHDEEVGDGAHPGRRVHNVADEAVAHQCDQEDDAVRDVNKDVEVDRGQPAAKGRHITVVVEAEVVVRAAAEVAVEHRRANGVIAGLGEAVTPVTHAAAYSLTWLWPVAIPSALQGDLQETHDRIQLRLLREYKLKDLELKGWCIENLSRRLMEDEELCWFNEQRTNVYEYEVTRNLENKELKNKES